MTETFYRTGTYDVTHSEFGGTICAFDFNRKTTLAEAAKRILADKRFDQQCQKNAAVRAGNGTVAEGHDKYIVALILK